MSFAKVFPNLPQNFRNRLWLSARAILAAKNYDVNSFKLCLEFFGINDYLSNLCAFCGHRTE
jgi:hypothetical protein